MSDPVQLRLQQLYDSLGAILSDDFGGVDYFRGIDRDTGNYTVRVDFTATESELLNAADLLINNIACLKDLLVHWCKEHGVSFDVEGFVNQNRDDVAVVHDLWNLRKHHKLRHNYRPRSGRTPRYDGLARGLRIDLRPGAPHFVMEHASNGMPIVTRAAPGQADLSIGGRIVDEHGAVIGGFQQICLRAIDAWERAMREIGVDLPPREPVP